MPTVLVSLKAYYEHFVFLRIDYSYLFEKLNFNRRFLKINWNALESNLYKYKTMLGLCAKKKNPLNWVIKTLDRKKSRKRNENVN